jgi:hypothetical protein
VNGRITFAGTSLVVALGAFAAAGCATPEARLTADVLARMQREARVEIYDRENDLAIARGKEDDARLRIEALGAQLEGLDKYGAGVRARLAKLGGDKATRWDPALSARRAYLVAQRRLAEASRALAEENVTAAHARLEQTRQRQLVRTGRALASSLAPFDASVGASEKRLRELERRDQDLRLEAEKAFETWKGAEDEFARATSDYDTGVWID